MEQNNSTFNAAEISVSLPVRSTSIFAKLKKSFFQLFTTFYNPQKSTTEDFNGVSTRRTRKFNFPKFKKFNFNKKKVLKIALPIVLVIVVVFVIVSIVKTLPDAKNSSDSTVTNQVTAPSAVASFPINKSFDFSVKDANGNDSGTFKYTILSAELQNKIIVQGSKATAVAGKVFLIFNLKIDNNLDKALQLNTRDYVRVILADNPDEKRAADIHNDPVDVQAISTTYTRIGLTVDESEAFKPMKVEIGEITGKKQTIEVKFKK